MKSMASVEDSTSHLGSTMKPTDEAGLENYSFRWPDFIVFSLVLLASLLIGLFHACTSQRQASRKEYFHGSHKLKWTPVGLSMLVTFQSAILFLGVPAEIYTYGIGYMFFHIGMAISVLIVAFYFVPLLYPLKMTSSFEYLERRFKSKVPRVIGSVLGLFNMVLYMGVAIFTPSVAMAAVSGVPVWASILTIGVVTTIYTTLGGMRAVIWTDVFQFTIMAGGLIVIFIVGSISIGGIGEAWKIAYNGGRMHVDILNPDPRSRHTLWGLLLGSTLTWLANIAVNQSSVQRFSSVPTQRMAQMSVLMSAPGFVIFGIISSCMGLLMYAHFTEKGCDPLKSGIIQNPNQLMPLYVMEKFESVPGFSGLFVASLCAASLSTVSSSLNGLSAMTWEDMLSLKCKGMSESRIAILIKILVVLYGIVAVSMALITAQIKGPATQIALSFFGASGGPMVGLFLLGALFPCANAIGASVGVLSAASLCFWIALGGFSIPRTDALPPAPGNSCIFTHFTQNPPTTMSPFELSQTLVFTDVTSVPVDNDASSPFQSLYQVSYLWYSGIGMLMTIIIGLLVSLCTGLTKPSTVNPDLLMSPCRRVYRSLPSAFKNAQCHEEDTAVFSEDKATVISDNKLISENGCSDELMGDKHTTCTV